MDFALCAAQNSLGSPDGVFITASPRVLGGSRSAANRVLLHPECHDRVHRLRVPVSSPRLPARGVREGLEPGERELSRTVLKGLGSRKAAWPLDNESGF